MEYHEIEQLLHALYLLSGIHISLYDRQFHVLASIEEERTGYCAAVQANPEGLARCFRSDLDAFATVEKTKRPYVFTCPFGLFEAVIPLLDGEKLLGFLFAGEAIAQEPDRRTEALTEAMRYVGKLQGEETLSSLVDQLPVKKAAELDAFLLTLTVLGTYLATQDFLHTHQRSLAELTKDYLNRHFHRRITLSELGLHFHCSTVTLTENFRHAFSCTIVQYLTQKRLEAAVQLLRHSEFSVGTVAEKCGFSGIEYFSKVFKRHYGCAPLHWRNANRP